MSRVHYLYDPQCGWCYGVAPLIAAMAGTPGIDLKLHGGGLWPQRTILPRAVREQIRIADGRIAELTGQPFGPGYLQGLLPSDAMVLDSRPTTAAVLAAGVLQSGGDLTMLRAIQRAHYELGQVVADPVSLAQLSQQAGFAPESYAQALAEVRPEAHIAQTHRLMQRLGVGGFPAVFVERDGRLEAVPPQAYFGRPAAFVDAVLAVSPASVH